MEEPVTAILKDLAFDPVVADLIEFFLELVLNTVGSYDCQAVEGLREMSVQ